MPGVGGREMRMALITYKDGGKKFEEAKVFKVKGTGKIEKTDETVSFGKR